MGSIYLLLLLRHPTPTPRHIAIDRANLSGEREGATQSGRARADISFVVRLLCATRFVADLNWVLMSELGHERRPIQEATAPQLPLCPVSDRDRVAAQYVVEGHNQTYAVQQIRRGYAVRSMRVSISLRSVPKSIGFVSSASAPFAKAFRFVSASP